MGTGAGRSAEPDQADTGDTRVSAGAAALQDLSERSGEGIVALRDGLADGPSHSRRLALTQLCSDTGDQLEVEDPVKATGNHFVAAEFAFASAVDSAAEYEELLAVHNQNAEVFSHLSTSSAIPFYCQFKGVAFHGGLRCFLLCFNFHTGSAWVPLLTLGDLYMGVELDDDVYNDANDLDTDTWIARFGGGFKYFLTNDVALSLNLNYDLASKEIYPDEDGNADAL